MNEIIKHSGDTYRYVDGGVIDGYVKQAVDPIPDGVPWIRWKGAKMPHSLWVQILAFFRWTVDSTKPSPDEALIRIYYNERTEQWAAWAPPQRGVGMSVKSVPEHPNWKQEEELSGFQLLGTGHHHCLGSAFQSGTDKEDEALGNGLHFTVGNLDKDFVSLHARAVFNRNMQEVCLSGWVDIADKYKNIKNLPEEFLPTAYKYSLTTNPPPTTEFPAQWKENFLKWNWNSPTQGSVGFNNGSEYGYWASTPGGGQHWVPYKKSEKNNNQGHNPNGTGLGTMTPSERGELEIEKMMERGVPLIELCLISRAMNQDKKEDWPRGDKTFDSVKDVIFRLGLNPRWLEKFLGQVITEKQVAAFAEAQNTDGQWGY